MQEQPGQEQRAFWAILLAMGVLLAWSMIFPMGSPPPPDSKVAHGEGSAAPSGLSETTSPTLPTTTPSAARESVVGVSDGAGTLISRRDGASALPVTVRVDGPDLSVVIDGRGARLIQVEIPAFVEGDGKPVQLIPDDGPGALASVIEVGNLAIATDRLVFDLVSDTSGREGRRLVWELPLEGMTLRKTFVIPPEGNLLRVEHELLEDQVGLTSWGLSWAGGLRVTEEQLGTHRGPYFQGSVLAEGKVQRKSEGDLKNGPLEFPGHTRFVAVHNKYFLGAIVPQGDDQGPARLWSAPSGGAEESSLGGRIVVERTAGLASNAVTYDVYVGPLDYAKLKEYGIGIEETVDLGWSWVRPLSRAILRILIWLHGLIPNYGVVIVLFSVTINLVFFPLTYKSTKSMRDMAELKPRIDALKEKYKGDAQKVSEATMRLYKEAGVNPLGGCLPLVLQMPIFFALYAVLFHTIELRQAPFFWWIRDLSQPDVLFNLPFALPFVGAGISLLPIIMGITSFFQSKATMIDPNQKAMVYMMPVMMTFIFFTMPSGLVLYWLTSNLFTIGQKALMKPSSPVPAAAES